MKKRSVGRPKEIKGQTQAVTFNLTFQQRQWLRRESKLRGISASDLLREILGQVISDAG